MPELADVAALSFAASCLRFIVGVLLCWAVLRGLDILAGVRFTNLMGRLSEDPRALSGYLGCRILAVALWGAACFS